MSGNSGNQPRGEGGGTRGSGGGRMSWAERLGSSLPSSLNRNILEVVLEKDEKGAFIVKEEECARLMQKIGLDLRPGAQVEEVQICPSGRGVILITLRDNVKIEDFCRYDVLVISESGIRSSMMKPAGKEEVVVTLYFWDTIYWYIDPAITNISLKHMFPDGSISCLDQP